MGVELLTERHKDQIAGVLSCYDRIIIQGTVPGWCYASGMTTFFIKYYLTGLGKQVALGLKLKNLYVIPELSAVPAR